MECGANRFCAGPLVFCLENEPYVEGYVMYASKSCLPNFVAYLFGGFDNGVHASSFVFRDGPPREA